jgi:hypothetical protein
MAGWFVLVELLIRVVGFLREGGQASCLFSPFSLLVLLEIWCTLS